MRPTQTTATFRGNRRLFIGGSDARIIMGDDEEALLRLWREKRGEVEPEDLSGNLIVQLGLVTEDLNRRWYEVNTGQVRHRTSRSRSNIRPFAGWRPPSTAASRRPGRCSKPSSCCRGRSPRRRRPRSTCRSCSTTCGSSRPGRGALGHHRRRQVGRDHHPLPIRSISTSSSPPSGSSGAVSRVASPLPCSASSRQSRGSRRSALSI